MFYQSSYHKAAVALGQTKWELFSILFYPMSYYHWRLCVLLLLSQMVIICLFSHTLLEFIMVAPFVGTKSSLYAGTLLPVSVNSLCSHIIDNHGIIVDSMVQL